MSEYGLALRVHRDIDPKIPKEKIVAYRDGFFEAFPEASAWRQALEAEFHDGSTETRTILGRRRMRVENPRQRWNAPIQGTATDAFKMAAVLLHERAGEVGGFKIVALIHDEVVLLVPSERSEEIEAWARGVMAEAAGSVVNNDLPESYHIPIEVDGGSGATLQEAKDAAYPWGSPRDAEGRGGGSGLRTAPSLPGTARGAATRSPDLTHQQQTSSGSAPGASGNG